MKNFLLLGLISLLIIGCTSSSNIIFPGEQRGPASVLDKSTTNAKAKSLENSDTTAKIFLKYLFAKNGNFKDMSKGDCKAFSNQNDFYCATKDCSAILKNQSSLCETSDCKAFIESNINLCTSATCKALLNDNQTLCDEKNRNCKVLFNPNLCETAECEGFLKGFQGRCTTPACNALVKENMNECEL